jgi:hypothetical protein
MSPENWDLRLENQEYIVGTRMVCSYNIIYHFSRNFSFLHLIQYTFIHYGFYWKVYVAIVFFLSIRGDRGVHCNSISQHNHRCNYYMENKMTSFKTYLCVLKMFDAKIYLWPHEMNNLVMISELISGGDWSSHVTPMYHILFHGIFRRVFLIFFVDFKVKINKRCIQLDSNVIIDLILVTLFHGILFKLQLKCSLFF